MQMTDLMSKEQWTELEQEINATFRVNACAYDADGFTFTGFKKFANPLCPEVKAKPEGIQAICSVAHQNMAAMARTKGRTVVAECDAGLLKICTPIQINGTFLGIIGGCGRKPMNGEVDGFVVEKAVGLDEHKCVELAEQVETMEDKEIEAMVDFLEGRVREILKASPKA